MINVTCSVVITTVVNGNKNGVISDNIDDIFENDNLLVNDNYAEF